MGCENWARRATGRFSASSYACRSRGAACRSAPCWVSGAPRWVSGARSAALSLRTPTSKPLPPILTSYTLHSAAASHDVYRSSDERTVHRMLPDVMDVTETRLVMDVAPGAIDGGSLFIRPQNAAVQISHDEQIARLEAELSKAQADAARATKELVLGAHARRPAAAALRRRCEKASVRAVRL